MSAVLLNVVIGLVTSVLSGGSVMTWRRVSDTRILHRKAAFFDLDADHTCLIVMGDHRRQPRSTHHNDVHAMIEVATLAYEARCPISVIPVEDLRESNGDRTEFCIGGPGSNPRTAGHLVSHLPGVRQRPYDAKRAAGAILVGDQQFLLDYGQLEHVLVAKFTPPQSSRPVFVIAGQRAIGNRAAIHFLKREYHNLSKVVDSLDRFCLILRVDSSDTYGYEATDLVADVTAAAFAPHQRAVPTATI